MWFVDCEIFVSVFSPLALKTAADGAVGTFATVNIGPRPHSPPNQNINNLYTLYRRLRTSRFVIVIVIIKD